MRTLLITLLLAIAGMLHGCAVLAPASVVHSCTVTRSGGVTYYSQGCAPSVPVYGQQPYSYGYGNKDVRVQTKEDEHGLVSFRVSESGLTEPQVDWLLKQIDDHKARCQNGGEMKKFERTDNVRANPYSNSRSGRGDTTLRVEYQCNRAGSTDRLAPRGGQSVPSTTPETKPAPLSVPRLKGTSV
jgi:hypothetical protein